MTDTDYAVAPGEFLEEFIDSGDFTIDELSACLGWAEDDVRGFIGGRIEVTEKMARDLERVVSIPACTWLDYEDLFARDICRLGLTREMYLEHKTD